ncbi:Hypothetical protein IALB_1937 [Ignavibacterium album JCM 16511]|uniref:Uncharacterized protein n=1 Tax=Ignavibacterium album (strain DSM 19864 / JCM 16511 / NBRC 101810 / Mat9-16) TaxID=945713 RepID=I0AKY6_IGNAJ|nr:hypothetical protein [Ignavibacterium album]AFH49643.1 Hypothetical protein IALB_1937 [Ignavibacterium album JCM 16511]
MAVIKKNILGTFQGSLSDIILRERNGKLIAYTKPAKQKVSKSQASLNARYKFALTVALAREINGNKTLSLIWAKSKIKATNSYQKLIKVNSAFTEPYSLTIKNKITPDGILLTGIAIQFNNNFLEITIDLSKLDRQLIKSNKLFCLVHFWKSNDHKTKRPNKPVFILQLFNFDLSDLEKNTTLQFLIDLKNLNKPGFNNGLALIALAGISDNKLLWSSTFGHKFI